MDSVREQIQNQLARSKINSDQLYSIIKQIADHIDAPKDVSPAPARTVKPAPVPAPPAPPAPAPPVPTPPAPTPAPETPKKKVVKRVVKKKVVE
jgi:hypothetical protein|tara:strand:- start:683 stop:964 length:282 start_codon:yes stop_codon:yes gene_type:complete